MKSHVWFKAGIVIIYGSSIDASPHRHHEIQLAWPRDGYSCKLDNKTISTPLIIGSNVEHQLQLDEGWILLVEPTSELGLVLSDKLLDQSSITFKVSPSIFNHSDSTDDLTLLLSPLFDALGLSNQFPLINESKVVDHRIKALLRELDRCLEGECIKPSHWRASEVAASLALSESRFLHLFSGELGVPWRPSMLDFNHPDIQSLIEQRKSFLGYGIATKCLSNPDVDWKGQDTYIQSEGIADYFGIYTQPDDFYSNYGSNLSGIKKVMFRYVLRHLMNFNVNKIRTKGLRNKLAIKP